jgi:hypothetical protein
MGMTIDFSDFEKGFRKMVEKSAPEAVGKGAFNAMNELLRDSVTESPGAPKDVGDLWGSRRVNKAEVEHSQISCEGGFDIEYATYLHEGQRKDGSHKIKNWTTDKGATDPGPKFLEKKMVQNKEKYMQITAESLKDELK